MFAFSLCKVWNVLPLYVRESDSVSIFKSGLKTYFFNLAFDVFCVFVFVLFLMYLFIFWTFFYWCIHLLNFFSAYLFFLPSVSLSDGLTPLSSF